jgi:hypothetical protein
MNDIDLQRLATEAGFNVFGEKIVAADGGSIGLATDSLRRFAELATETRNWRPSTLFGLNIIEVPTTLVPKIKLSDDCPCSDAFRAEFNAWLLEMFGTRDVSFIKPGMAYMFGGNVMMRHESIVRLNCSA